MCLKEHKQRIIDSHKRVKILHIQVLPKLSGVQKVSLEIFKNLPEKYDKYIMFSVDSDVGDVNESISEFEATGAKIIFSKNLKREICSKDWKAFKEIYQLCKKERFDIVHTNSTKPGIIGRIAATLANVPYIVHTIHGLAFHKFVSRPKWIFYWACEMIATLFCNKVIIVNRYYTRYFKWCKNKITVIYNGLDLNNFKTQGQREKENDDLVRVLFVGRLDVQKNPLMLLKAAKKILQKNGNVRFTIVGDGEYLNDCKNYIEKHGLSDNVILVGWQNNVSKFYSTHDILAIPSLYEAFGLIFLEAGFYHLPAVSTNVEGIPEVVENEKTGLLSNPNDVEGFTHNLLSLIKDKQKRKDMGEAAYNRVTTQFSTDLMVKKYLEIYEGRINNNTK